MIFFLKSCSGDANKDVVSVTRQVADGKSGSSQTLRGTITKMPNEGSQITFLRWSFVLGDVDEVA